MKARLCIVVALLLKMIVTSPAFAQTQNKLTDSASDAPKLTADYPRNPPGVLIQGSAWMPITPAAPFKTHTKHAAASFFSDGVVPAAIVADYEGPHAAVEVEPGQPMICICHIIGMPGNPVLVKLHPKKQFRELDGGNLPIFGSKVAEAKKKRFDTCRDITTREYCLARAAKSGVAGGGICAHARNTEYRYFPVYGYSPQRRFHKRLS